MNCPQCGSSDLSCKDSRQANKIGFICIRRRKLCGKCKFRFTTWEISEMDIVLIEERSNFTLSQMQTLINHIRGIK